MVDEYSNAVTTNQVFTAYLNDETNASFSPISVSFSASDLSSGTFTGTATISSTLTGTLALYVHVIEANLLGYYYDNTAFTLPIMLKNYDSQLNFDWGTGVVGGIKADDVSVRWTGYLYSATADTYELSVVADKALVYVNGSLTLDTTNSITAASLSLSSANYNSLRVDYVEESGTASIVMSWKVGSASKEVVPASALFHKVSTKQSSEIADGPQSVTVNAS